MFNLNQKQIEMAMKKMGMQTQQIDAKKVIIECASKKIVIDSPQVTKIKLSGQETFQIIGEAVEKAKEKFSQADIELVMEQTGCTEEEAQSALQETGDIAQAIMKLKKV